MSVVLGPKLGLLNNANIGDAYFDQFRPFLRAIDALLLGNVINSTTTTPPSSPANGDAYLLLGTPTGAWAGKANTIAVWSTQITVVGSNSNTLVPGWEFHTPNAGWTVWNVASSQMLVYNGTAWVSLQAQIAAVANGGTGTTSLTGLVKGNGTSPFTAAIAGTDYQAAGSYLTSISVTAANGVSGTSSGGTTPSLTFSLGSITPSTIKIGTSSVITGVQGSGSLLTSASGTFSAGNLRSTDNFNNTVDSGVAVSNLALLSSANIFNAKQTLSAGLVIGSSQSITSIQGSTGTKLAATIGAFTSGNLTGTDANGNVTDSGLPISSIPSLTANNQWSGTQTFIGSEITSSSNCAAFLWAVTSNIQTLYQVETATPAFNYGSGTTTWQAQYYNGSTSVADNWSINNLVGSGSSPTSTLTFSHNGSTGVVSVSIPYLTAVGSLSLSASTTSTSATAGSATALPSVPVGYVTVTINGTARKIPYYT